MALKEKKTFSTDNFTGGEFEWMSPFIVSINGSDLHWGKISPGEVRESFKTLEKIRPFIQNASIKNDRDRRMWKQFIIQIKDNSGEPLLKEDDLRYYDLYFGADKIKIEKINNKYDVVNGRHRLWLAQKENIKTLPVFMQKVYKGTTEYRKMITEENMGEIDLRDVEKEAKEQQEQAESMYTEMEQHKDQVEKLSKSLQEIKALSKELKSDNLKNAEIAAEKAKSEVESRMKEIKEQRDKLLKENRQLTEKVKKAYEGRAAAMDKIGVLEIVSKNSGDEIKAHIETIRNELHNDMNKLGSVDQELYEAREKLEKLNI